jgi:hypothetical protein
MSKEKAIEICNNLEQSINKALISVLSNKNSMFAPYTASKSRLRETQKKVMKEYNLTKKDLL